MNPLVVQKATVGMANFVIHHYGEGGKKRGVAVSFDSRHHSQEFAKEVCDILNAYGINTFTLLAHTLLPSFLIQLVRCIAVLVLW